MSLSLHDLLSDPVWQGVGALLAGLGVVVTGLQTSFRGRTGGWFFAVLATTIFVAFAAMIAARRLIWAHPIAGVFTVVSSGVMLTIALACFRPAARYQHAYRTWAHDSVRYVRNRRLGIAGSSNPRVDDIYVDVSLVPRPLLDDESGMLSDVDVDPSRRHSVWEFLDDDRFRVLAIRGQPGGGKTTLLLHVGGRLASKRRMGRRQIPVLLELREHGRHVVNDPEITLPGLLRRTLRAPDGEPRGWWEKRLAAGRCVVLLDGLDEIFNPEDRATLSSWLNDQIALYQRTAFVVTSRPHAYRGPVLDAALILQVRPFTDDQVSTFVQAWYRTLETQEGDGDAVSARTRADQAAKDLINRIINTPALHDLAVNPLLLTMIVNVHRNHGALPKTRAALYTEMCSVVLGARGDSRMTRLHFGTDDKTRVLAALAYEMMNRPSRTVRRAEIRQTVSSCLGQLPQGVTPDDFVDEATASGILVGQELGEYSFVHLTFQEHLAATHIRSINAYQDLANHVDDPAWREVTLLAVTGTNADQIILAAVNSGSLAALSLAYECFEIVQNIDRALRRRLDDVVALAFRRNADSQHRRLVAGVLAIGYLNAHSVTSGGSQVCYQPIRTDLYHLYLADTRRPLPDGPCPTDPTAATAVTGLWGSDATAFVAWLNSVTAITDAAYRLPIAAELAELVERGGIAGQSVRLAGHVWTQQADNPPELWAAPSLRSPVTVSGTEILKSLIIDAAGSPVPWLLLSHAVRVRAENLRWLVEEAARRARKVLRMRRGILERRADQARRLIEKSPNQLQAEVRNYEIHQAASMPGAKLDLMHPHDSLSAAKEDAARLRQLLAYADPANLARSQERPSPTVPESGVPRSGDVFEGECVEAAHTYRILMAALARADQLVAVLASRGVGLDAALTNRRQALGLVLRLDRLHRLAATACIQMDPSKHRDVDNIVMARDRMRDRAAALVAARKAGRQLARDLAGVTDEIIASRTRSHPGLVPPLAPISQYSYNDPAEATMSALRECLGAGAADVVARTIANARDHSVNPPMAFAHALLAAAGVASADELDIRLDWLAHAAFLSAEAVEGRTALPTWTRRIAGHLLQTVRPTFLRAAQPAPDAFSTARIVALILAAESVQHGDSNNIERLLHVAAGMTLMQERTRGLRPTPEALIVARA
ncbi:NACHT domain-containing protein [Micromonospora arida]